jgi:hypothetical protein
LIQHLDLPDQTPTLQLEALIVLFVATARFSQMLLQPAPNRPLPVVPKPGTKADLNFRDYASRRLGHLGSGRAISILIQFARVMPPTKKNLLGLPWPIQTLQ